MLHPTTLCLVDLFLALDASLAMDDQLEMYCAEDAHGRPGGSGLPAPPSRGKVHFRLAPTMLPLGPTLPHPSAAMNAANLARRLLRDSPGLTSRPSLERWGGGTFASVGPLPASRAPAPLAPQCCIDTRP